MNPSTNVTTSANAPVSTQPAAVAAAKPIIVSVTPVAAAATTANTAAKPANKPAGKKARANKSAPAL